MTHIEVSTIGFTKKSAETFFSLLRNAKVRTVLDVRLNNTSQLAGFAKKADLRFLLSELLGVQYIELGELAPEKEMLQRYQLKERHGTLMQAPISTCSHGAAWKAIWTFPYSTGDVCYAARTNLISATGGLRSSISTRAGTEN